MSLSTVVGAAGAMSTRTILITGASSGIGAALARAYAAPDRRLILWGRNSERLAETAAACGSRGAAVSTIAIDLTDLHRFIAELDAVDAQTPIDLAIFNAGIGGSLPAGCAGHERKAAEAMAGVNFMAPVLGANLMSDRMAQRRTGRIVLIGSVAAQFPLPMAPIYSGSKAGLEMFAEALQLRLKPYGVGVTLVSPGFVDTPMSRSLTEPKPFLISPDQAARVIVRKVARGARRVIVPWQFALICFAARLVPRPIMRAVLRRF